MLGKAVASTTSKKCADATLRSLSLASALRCELRNSRIIIRFGDIDHFSRYNKTPYVVKPVSKFVLEDLHDFQAESKDCPRLRNHADRIGKRRILVYEYFKSDLLALVENYTPLPLTARKKILNEIGDTPAEMHEKKWIHFGTESPACPSFDEDLLI